MLDWLGYLGNNVLEDVLVLLNYVYSLNVWDCFSMVECIWISVLLMIYILDFLILDIYCRSLFIVILFGLYVVIYIDVVRNVWLVFLV